MSSSSSESRISSPQSRPGPRFCSFLIVTSAHDCVLYPVYLHTLFARLFFLSSITCKLRESWLLSITFATVGA